MTKDKKNSLLPQIPEVISLNGEDLEYKKKVQQQIDEYRSFNIQQNKGEENNNPPDDDSIFYHSRPSPNALKELNLGRKEWQKERERKFSETPKSDKSTNEAHILTEDVVKTVSPTMPPIRVHYFNSPEQEQLRQQWSTLSQEKKQEYLPLIPVVIPVLPEHSSHIEKLYEDINEYRTYTIINQPEYKDDIPPDDEFIVKTLFKRPDEPTSHAISNMIHHVRLHLKKDSITTVQIYVLDASKSDNLICYLRRSDSTILAQQSFKRFDKPFLTMSKQPKNAYVNCQVFTATKDELDNESMEYTTNSVLVEDHAFLLFLYTNLMIVLKYILWGGIIVALTSGIFSLIFYLLHDRTEESHLSEKSHLIGSGQNEDLRSYATRTMQLFNQDDKGIDVVEQMVEKSRRDKRHESGATANICKFCGYKNSRNAVYCFNCNGIIGKPVL